MKNMFRGALSLFLTLTMVLSMAGIAWAAYLGIPVILQYPYSETGCWAASGASVCRYYGNTQVTLESFAGSLGTTPNFKRDMSIVQTGLSLYGISSIYYEDDANFSINASSLALRNHIDTGHTVVMNLSGHCTVLNGYSTSNVNALQIMDPWYGYIDLDARYLFSGTTEGYRLLSCLLTNGS